MRENLAVAYVSAGMRGEAAAAFEDLLSIYTGALDADHPRVTALRGALDDVCNGKQPFAPSRG
jgi:hypothetical protein